MMSLARIDFSPHGQLKNQIHASVVLGDWIQVWTNVEAAEAAHP
jgi:hypothetical protein